ncbi:hypothetical protein Lnau_0377 [Legionella nautarum]|uniref:Uncharacterized protein n=1 Tax=Legionella nautarum TaxID=45070 RepID=A0A0W0X2S7_9GAMM|nr:hypothetical protein [Legionella nautarum]KTD38883.1 hypothetical protein Lnau_0377 [Legionella nautarum]
MADDRGRLRPSDLNRCLVDALYEEVEVRLYYPKPIFEGFNSVLGDKDRILNEGKQAWKKASRDSEWAQEWQAILDCFANERPYTLDQLDLIESRIKQGNQKKFYTNLQKQKLNEDDKEDLEILQEDIKSASLGIKKFSSLFDQVAIIANSSYQLIENRLIIIHATVDTTKEITPEISADLIIDELKRQGVVLDEVEITHLIPEVGKGRLDGLFGVNHIRLRIAQGDPIDMPGSQLIDPRDLYQGTFDTVNCGRYVATMIGQAVGLYKENRQITVEALRASPIVKNAAKFTSAEALQAATKFASEYPVDVELQQNEVERIIEQIRQLNYTYQQRVTLGAEYNHFWGSFFGAYSATQKQNISQKILDGADLNAADQKIAEQGDLGNLYRQLEEARKKDNSPSDEESLKSNFG